MMKEVRVSAADFGGNSLQGHGLRPLFEQEFARRGEGRGPTFFGAEACSSY